MEFIVDLDARKLALKNSEWMNITRVIARIATSYLLFIGIGNIFPALPFLAWVLMGAIAFLVTEYGFTGRIWNV